MDVPDEFLRQGLDRVEAGPPPGAGYGVDGTDCAQCDARTVDERRPQIGTDTYLVDDRIAREPGVVTDVLQDECPAACDDMRAVTVVEGQVPNTPAAARSRGPQIGAGVRAGRGCAARRRTAGSRR